MESTEPSQNGGGDILSGLVEDFLGTLSPEMSKQLSGILTEDMGLSKTDTEKFIRYQRHIRSQRMILGKDEKTERILGPRYQWIKELATDTADQLSLFVVGCLLSNRTARMKRIREKVLDHLCDITGENTTVESATTRVQRTLVIVADRMATWIDETITNIEKKQKKICEPLEIITSEQLSTASSETLSSTESEAEISKKQSDLSTQAKSDVVPSIESFLSEEIEPDKQEDARLSQESQKIRKPETEEKFVKKEEVEEKKKEKGKSAKKGKVGKPETEVKSEKKIKEKRKKKDKSVKGEIEREDEDSEVNENWEQTEDEEETEEDGDKTIESEESDMDEDKSEASSESEEEILTTEESEEVSDKSTDDEEDVSEKTDTEEEKSISEDDEDEEDDKPLTESSISESSGFDSEGKLSKTESSTEDISVVETASELSVEPEAKEKNKLPTDILELLKKDIIRMPKVGEKSDRQKAMRAVIDKRFEEIAKEILEKSVDSLTKHDINEAASVLANWVENLLSSTDKISALPDVPSYTKRQGPSFEIKQGHGSQYQVHKLSSTTVAQKVAQLRGVELPLRKKRVPRTSSPINLDSAKDWADWALDAANVGEEWGKWLDATLTDVEQKLLMKSKASRTQIEKHSEWKDWRDSKEREAQKWRVERLKIKHEGDIWNRKLQKQNTQPEKETKVLNY